MSSSDETPPIEEVTNKAELPEPVEEGEIQVISKELFDLQLTFAKKALELAESAEIPISLNYALSEGTNIRRKLDLYGEEHQEEWESLINSIEEMSQEEQLATIYEKYKLTLQSTEASKQDEHDYYGCFWYHITSENEVFLHFANREPSGESPISDSKFEQRRIELKEMFKHIKKAHPNATEVTSKSWTYNLPKFNRLFPEEYTKNAQQVKTGLSRFDYWGQFLQRSGEVRTESKKEFLKRLDQANSVDDLVDCFPLHPRVPKCNIQHFYQNLGI